MARDGLPAIHRGIHHARGYNQGDIEEEEGAVHWPRVPDVYYRDKVMRVEIQMSEIDETIGEDYMKRIRALADTRPEIILFILEELMSQLLSEEEKGGIIRRAIARWTEEGRDIER